MSEENGIQDKSTPNEGNPQSNVGDKETISVPAPQFGFTEKGTFYLEVDVRLGFVTILGVLTRAISYVNGALNQQDAKMREQEKQRSLLKPKSSNGLGKFFGLAK